MDIFNKKQKETADQTDKTEKSVGKLDDAFRAISPSTLSAVAGVTALIASVKSLISVGSNIINVSSQFEQTQKSLETVLQSAEKGQQLFEDLRKFSFDTTFGVDELASASNQLLNAGESIEKLQGDLKMLGDLAQGDKGKFAELTSIFAKIQNTGKATSIQLNQLALRGIPIQKTLKEMGVTGVASAEDLTKAFKKLTDEGGQFHDAMNNIIDTIEGKRGFISDTLKEINVNFGELTGITDTYKEALDFVYDILDKVNNKLMEWNENPVMKAIMSGLLATALTAVVTIIGVSLVGALNTIIVKLGIIAGLKALISPVGAVAGLIAVIGGVTAGVKAFNRETEKTAEEVEKFAKASLEAKKALEYANNLRANGITPIEDSRGAQLSNAQKYLEGLTEGSSKAEEKLAELQREIDEWGANAFEFDEDLERNYNYYSKIVEANKQRIKDQEALVKQLQDEYNVYEGLKQQAESFSEIYESTLPKEQQEMLEIERQLKAVLDYKKELERLAGTKDNEGNLIKFDDDTRRAIDDTIKYFENKLKGVNAWEDVFKSVTGISIPKAGTESQTRGQIAGADYQSYMQKLYDAQVKAETTVGTKNASSKVAEDMVKTIENQIKELIANINVDEPFEETDATIRAMIESMNYFKSQIEETAEETKTFKDIIEEWQNSENMSVYAGGVAMNTLVSASSDASNFLEGMAQTGGNWIGGLINMLIGALANVASTCDNFERAMNPITTAFQKLKPLLQVLIDEGADFTSGLEMILDILKPFIDAFGFLLRIGRAVGTVFNLLLAVIKQITSVANAILDNLGMSIDFDSMNQKFDKWFEDMDDYMGIEKDKADAEKEQLATQRALQNAYQNMLTTLKEVQEEYEHRKKDIMAQGFADEVTGVHDMILTPQGKFSTDPDDYIIATKNPNGLGGGLNQNVIINNYTSDSVQTSTDDNGNLIIQISQKVAYDYANGNNGWDSAVQARQSRIAGRSLAM